jgi:Ca2+-transporting ATPase
MDIAILDGVSEPLPWTEVARFPYTEGRKRETGIVQENGELLAAVKGAPEVVIAQCNLAPEEAAGWMARVDSLAREGHKVIACAWRTLRGDQWPGGEPDRNFEFAGALCFEDPVRPGVAEALRACRAAGIRVVMVTGDHPSTAFAIAREIGLNNGNPRVVAGDALGACLDRNRIAAIDVVARAAPAVKLDLVRALQAQGNIVAVTGDGVNDVPALLAADVGIAMGERGTRSAREVGSIVLLNDDFGTIVRAIHEGHQLFANLQMSFAYLLMIHLPLVATAALIPLAGFPLLYFPVHIVWLELIIHPTALLVFQELPADATPISAPRDRRARFFSRGQWFLILAVGIIVTVVVAATYIRSLGADFDVEHARAMAIVALTVASAGITAGLSGLRGRIARILVLATLLLSVLLVQVPALAALLHLRPLHLEDWILALAGGLVAAALAAVTRNERIGLLFSRRSTL